MDPLMYIYIYINIYTYRFYINPSSKNAMKLNLERNAMLLYNASSYTL